MAFTLLVALVRKDLQLFFHDRRAVILSFAVPIAIASFFGTIVPGSGSRGGTSAIPVVVADQDGSAISRSIVARMQGDPALALSLTAADSARDLVRRGTATVGVVIPPGFGERAGPAFFAGRDKPELELVYDPSHGAELGMVRGMLMGHVMEAVSREMFTGPAGQALIETQLRRLDSATLPPEQKTLVRDVLLATRNLQRGAATTATTSGLSVPYTVREAPATARAGIPYNGYAHSFVGMGIQFLLFAAIDVGIGVLLERQRGLWKRLRSAPISRLTLLGAKAVSGMLITLMVLLVSFSFAMLVFRVRILGSLAGFGLVAVATAFMASTFGLLVAALGKTPQATRSVATFSVLIMVMLGGAWVPSFIFPGWLQKATIVIPARWAVDGLDAMTWRGVGFGGAIMPTVVLLGFSLLFVTLALARFRWEE